MEALLIISAGCVYTFITEISKKIKIDPKVSVAILCLGGSVLYVFIQKYVPRELTQNAVAFGLETFAVSKIAYSYVFKFLKD